MSQNFYCIPLTLIKCIICKIPKTFWSVVWLVWCNPPVPLYLGQSLYFWVPTTPHVLSNLLDTIISPYPLKLLPLIHHPLSKSAVLGSSSSTYQPVLSSYNSSQIYYFIHFQGLFICHFTNSFYFIHLPVAPQLKCL